MGASGFTRVLVAALVAMAGFVMVAPSAAACGDVDVQTEDDACARVLAVSVHGDARGDGACNDAVGCIAVSGTGNASNTGRGWSCGATGTPSVTCIAVSGTGDASNEDHPTPDEGRCGFPRGVTGDVTLACWSVSGTGNASFHGDSWSCMSVGSCVAVSGAGEARGWSDRCYSAVPCGTCVSPERVELIDCGYDLL